MIRSGPFDPPEVAVRQSVGLALLEDLVPLGDVTSSLIPAGVVGVGRISAREPGVMAGRACAAHVFAEVAPAVATTWHVDDGDEIGAGAVLASVAGPLVEILAAERTALNYLGHLSGVATMTNRCVRAAGDRTRIRDSRKTLPGLRALQKAAVRAGGGVNHRGSLSDAVLVKDNHLTAIDVGEVIARARARWPGHTVEIECDTIDQVREAVGQGADMVMLDNMTVAEVAQAVGIVGGRCLVEVSGGVTPQTVGDYSATGVDYIAIGALTHSAPSLDIGLDLDVADGDGDGGARDGGVRGG